MLQLLLSHLFLLTVIPGVNIAASLNFLPIPSLEAMWSQRQNNRSKPERCKVITSWTYKVLAVWPRARYLASLTLGFITRKTERTRARDAVGLVFSCSVGHWPKQSPLAIDLTVTIFFHRTEFTWNKPRARQGQPMAFDLSRPAASPLVFFELNTQP